MNALSARAWVGNETPLPKRKWGLTRGLWWAFGFLVLTCGLGDVATTAIAVNSTYAAEGNAWVASLLQGGFAAFVLIKVLFLLGVYGLAWGLIVIAWPNGLKVFQVGLWVYAASFAVISVSNLMAVYLGNDLLNFIANHTSG